MRLFSLIPISALALLLGGLPAAAQSPSPAPAASPAPKTSPAPAAAVLAEDPAVTKVARTELDAWESGKVDRSKYSAEANKHITDDLISQVSKQMGPLGAPTAFKYAGHAQQFGMDVTNYEATFPQIALIESIALDATGKITFIYFVPKQ